MLHQGSILVNLLWSQFPQMQLAGLIDLIFDQSNNCVLPADDQITWWPWHEERIVREVTYLRYKFICDLSTVVHEAILT